MAFYKLTVAIKAVTSSPTPLLSINPFFSANKRISSTRCLLFITAISIYGYKYIMFFIAHHI